MDMELILQNVKDKIQTLNDKEIDLLEKGLFSFKFPKTKSSRVLPLKNIKEKVISLTTEKEKRAFLLTQQVTVLRNLAHIFNAQILPTDDSETIVNKILCKKENPKEFLEDYIGMRNAINDI